MEDLIKEAIERKEEILNKAKNHQSGHYLAIYESDNGYTVGYIQQGHVVTSGKYISFPNRVTENYFNHIIAREKEDIYYQRLANRGE